MQRWTIQRGAPKCFVDSRHLQMGLRPIPRLGRSRGPLLPAPLPRGRALARRYRHLALRPLPRLGRSRTCRARAV